MTTISKIAYYKKTGEPIFTSNKSHIPFIFTKDGNAVRAVYVLDELVLYKQPETYKTSDFKIYEQKDVKGNNGLLKTDKILKQMEKEKNIWAKLIEFITNIFNPKQAEQLSLPAPRTIVDDKKEFIDKSNRRLSRLGYYYNNFKLEMLKDIFDFTKMTHDVIVSNDLKPQLLEQFHTYYTDNFLNLFDKIIDNNKLRVSLIEKRKKKVSDDISKLNLEKNKENNKIKDLEKLKKDVLKYNELVKKHILNDLDQKICANSLRH